MLEPEGYARETQDQNRILVIAQGQPASNLVNEANCPMPLSLDSFRPLGDVGGSPSSYRASSSA